MLEIMPQSEDDFVAVKVKGSLTHQDYQERFIPIMSEAIEKFGKIDVLFIFEESSMRIEWGAIWDDCRFGLANRKNFRRVGVVGGPAWVRWFESVGSLLTTSKMRFFPQTALIEAMEWVHPKPAMV